MKPIFLTTPGLALLLAACGAGGNSAAGNAAVGANQASANAADANTANAAAPAGNGSPAAPGPLVAYVGHLPSDRVGDATFLANPLVRQAVEATVSDAAVRRWVLREDVTSSPVAMQGSRLLASGCESHNCGHYWTIQIDPAGSAAEICYASGTGDANVSTHYVAGRPAEQRPGLCPRADGQ